MLEKKITFDSFIRSIITLAIVVGVLMLLDRLSGVLLPFFIAWLIAYLMYPLVRFFQYKLRLKNRVLSIFAALLTVTVILIAAFYFLVPPMIQEATKVKDLLVTYFTSGIPVNSAGIPQSLSEFLYENINFEALNQMLSQENILNILRTMLPKVWNILSGSINFLFSLFALFIIILYIVFILMDYEAIAEGWIRFVPRKYRTFASGLFNDVQQGMNKYFRGQALVALCVGILFSIGFLIIDFPLAIGLGLFIGALNLVPYLQIVGFIPTIMLAILKAADTGQSFWIIIISALAVFVIVQVIQDGVIVPKIMGKITGLNPAVILLSLSVWGSLLGFLGLIIALPLTTLILSYYQRFILGNEKIISIETRKAADNQSTPKGKKK